MPKKFKNKYGKVKRATPGGGGTQMRVIKRDNANFVSMDDEEAPRSKRLRTSDEQIREETTKATDVRRLIVILEDAQLETGKVGAEHELLSSDKHATFLRKMGRDPADYRPDITHQCLLMLMDSPLNRAGMLRVFVHTARNVLIEISPQTRIPRTYDRFAGLMVQLLHKLCIRAADSSQKLLSVIRNPVSDHLPPGCVKLCTSFNSERISTIHDIVPPKAERARPIVLVVGAIARGQINVNYTEGTLKISNYPLSAALTCAKLCHCFEEDWGIV